MKLSVSCFFVLFLLTGCREGEEPSVQDLVGKGGLLETVIDMVRENFAKDVDTQKLVQGSINGALRTLDEYSVYYSEKDYKTFLEFLKGQFGGIGVEIRPRIDGLEVIAPLEGGPAHKMGIRSGDILTTLDGERIATMTPLTVIQKIHGNPGTSLKIGYMRGGKDMPALAITREIIKNSPVKGEILQKIAYFRLSAFTDQSTVSFLKMHETLTKKLQEEEGANATFKGVILDLRDNPGGTLDQAVSMTGIFLASGDVVRVESRDPSLNRTLACKGQNIFKDIPIVVLINHGSASASEVLSGALRDHKRAILMGEKSYGKGSVQRIFDMEKRGAVSLTVAYFKTPKGHPINGVGLEPDVVVERLGEGAFNSKDTGKDAPIKDVQKDRAIDLLRGLAALGR